MIIELKDLQELIDPGMRLMGLDVGEKTIGLALSDTLITIATPFETIPRTKFTKDAENLLAKAPFPREVIPLAAVLALDEVQNNKKKIFSSVVPQLGITYWPSVRLG